MRCDNCGCQLTPANDGGFAPNGLPLYVCKACYQKLKNSRIVEKDKKEKINGR